MKYRSAIVILMLVSFPVDAANAAASDPSTAAKEVTKSGSPTSPLIWSEFDQQFDISADGSARIVTVQEVQPMTAEAAQSLSAIPIPVSKSLQALESVEGWIEDASGKRTPIDPKTVITQAPPYAAEAMTLSDIELKVLPLPQVAVGGRVRLVITVRQLKPFFPGNYFNSVVDVPWMLRKQSRVAIAAPASLPVFVENCPPSAPMAQI